MSRFDQFPYCSGVTLPSKMQNAEGREWKFERDANFGYLRVAKSPTDQELRAFYEKKYYQREHGEYRQEYSRQEIEFFTRAAHRAINFSGIRTPVTGKKIAGSRMW